MDQPTFLLTDETGNSTCPDTLRPDKIPDNKSGDHDSFTPLATDVTHLTIDPTRPGPNVVTDQGRRQLRTDFHMTEKEIDSAVAKLKTVTFSTAMDYRGHPCSHVFDGLSEVSKNDSLKLESLMIHHISDTQSYNRQTPMNPYRSCISSLPIRASSYIVFNDYDIDYDYAHLPRTFIVSTPVQDDNSTALTFAELCESNQESIHFGLLENPRSRLQKTVIEGGVVPDHDYLTIFANLTTLTVPHSVAVVDLLVDRCGSAPYSSPEVYNIDTEGARLAIQQRNKKYGGTSAKRQREGGVGTEYTFVDRDTFNASHAGRVLDDHLEASGMK